MRLAAAAITLTVLISLALTPSLSGQSRGRPQTFEGAITLPPRNAAAPASLTGTVVSQATGEPLAAATVTLVPQFGNAVLALVAEEASGSKPITTVRTNESGNFSFREVPAGTYGLNVRSEGYFPPPAGERIVLAAGQQLREYKIGLIRSSRIGGLIRNERGEPLDGVPVQLFTPQEPVARVGATLMVQATTAADGTYRLDGFSPGRYLLIAGWPE